MRLSFIPLSFVTDAPLRLLVVDKSFMACARIRDFLDKEPGVEVICLVAGDGQETLAMIDRDRPDIIFWDSDLFDRSGEELLSRMSAGSGPVVVVVSADPRFALDAFRIGAIDYLLKPVDRKRCRDAIQRAVERAHLRRAEIGRSRPANGLVATGPQQVAGRMLVRSNGRVVILNMADIVWVEASCSRLVLHMTNGNSWRLRQSLVSMERRLRPLNFIRISRSILVAAGHVRELLTAANGGKMLAMRGGARLALRRNWRTPIERILKIDE